MAGITADQENQVVDFMMSKVGDRYTQANPARFGPNQFDCSGLIWAAMTAAGIQMPQSQAIAVNEMRWLGGLSGANVITDPSQIQRGDVIGFTGADPSGSTNVGGHPVGGIGHIGVATGGGDYVSAYDTAEGVRVNPISGDHFVIAVRPIGGVPAGGSGSGSGGLLDLSGLISAINPSTGGVSLWQDLDSIFSKGIWIFQPSNWLRILAAFMAITVLAVGVYALHGAAQ